MDPAIKSGFAIGFVIVAIIGGLFAHQKGLIRLPSERQTAPQAALDPKPKPDDAPAPSPQDKQAETPSAPSPVVPETPAKTEAAPDQKPADRDAKIDPSKADPSKGAFDIVRVEPSGEMVVAGRCASGCTAELLANGKTQDKAKADAEGNWTMTPPALAPGDYQLGLRVTSSDGAQATSEQSVTVSVPAAPSKDVVVVLNEPNAPSRILEKPEEPAAPAAVAKAEDQPPAAAQAPAAEGPITLGAVDAENGRFFVQGSAPPGAKLRIYLNDAAVASATANADGRWSLKVERGLSPGDYVMRVDRLADAGGKVSSRVETKFSYGEETASAAKPGEETKPSAEPKPGAEARAAQASPSPADQDRPAPAEASAAATPRAPEPQFADRPAPEGPTQKPAGPAAAPAASPPSGADARAAPPADEANPVVASLDTVKVRRGDSLWRISRTSYGHGRRYTIIFAANDNQIRDPDLIYPGQVLVVPDQQAGASDAAAPR